MCILPIFISQDQTVTKLSRWNVPMRNKSEENWRVVSLCLHYDTLNAAASRLYYAVFQAVLTYAIAKKEYVYNPEVSVHLLMRNYVRETPDGKFFERVFSKLLSLRITADYELETPPKKQIESFMKDSGEMRRYFFTLAES